MAEGAPTGAQDRANWGCIARGTSANESPAALGTIKPTGGLPSSPRREAAVFAPCASSCVRPNLASHKRRVNVSARN
jgi:hypothetical protein